ncbi:MAG TPA: DMT family transporter [Acidimicrobiales bacterium]|nr:DMT family transporter [Acidimicrobiales bacterium]
MTTIDTAARGRRRVPYTRSGGVGLAFVTSLVSGVSIFTNGHAIRRFEGSAAFTTAKNLVAAVALGALLAALTARRSGEGWTPPRTRGARLGLVAVGVVGGSVPFLLFFEGLSRATSADAAFIHKTLVVWVAVLAVVLLRERLGWPHLAAIAALVAGQAALTDDLAGLGFGSGEMLVLAATLLWSVEVVIAKRLLGRLSALTVGMARMALGSVVLIGWLAVTGRLDDLAAYSASQWGWVVLTGALLTAYVATWYAALARAQAVDVTAVLVFGAVVTAVLAGALDGVPVRPDLPGLVLVAVGVAVVALRPGKRPALAR